MRENFDDFWQQIEPLFRRPGPAAQSSDSGLMTMEVVGKYREWDTETPMLSQWKEHQDSFPHIPSQSRFNRWRWALSLAFNLIRQIVLAGPDLSADGQVTIDSLLMPVVKFHLVPGSRGDWATYGADFGRVARKKITIFGFKLHLLVSLSRLILDFELAPASTADLKVGAELSSEHADLTVLGDKGYINAELTRQLLRHNRLKLLTLPSRSQAKQLPEALNPTLNAVRQIIETVDAQQTEQFNLQLNHAHTFHSLCIWLLTKLAAHTLCIYLNRLLGKADFLQIKEFAFPI